MKPRERVVVDTNALIGRLLHPFRGIDILTPAGYLARWREPAVGGKAAYRQGEPASVRVVHGTPGFRALGGEMHGARMHAGLGQRADQRDAAPRRHEEHHEAAAARPDDGAGPG